MEEIYDKVSHDFDEHAKYYYLAEYQDCYGMKLGSFIFNDKYEHMDIMKKLCDKIKSNCEYDNDYSMYIIDCDKLNDILSNFYKDGERKE